MEYYKILNLTREPFSNSPEPEFFYESPHHVECLQKLELAIRIRRGLNVVLGDVGTGKTTLSRQLIRKFASDDEVATHLLLDPHFSTEREFIVSIAEMFGLIEESETVLTDWQLRERVKKYLFDEAVEKSRIVVLIIDEGQKIPDFCLETLREFLNYETNEYKLLQIVIFAQEEFRDILARNSGIADRINLSYSLGPLNFHDTKAMVLFRIEQAMERGKEIPVQFTGGAMRQLYKATGGYPRKIVKLCHQILLTLIIQNKTKAGAALVKSIARRVSEGDNRPAGAPWAKTAILAGLVLILLMVVFERGYLNALFPGGTRADFAQVTQKTTDRQSDVVKAATPSDSPVEKAATAPPQKEPKVLVPALAPEARESTPPVKPVEAAQDVVPAEGEILASSAGGTPTGAVDVPQEAAAKITAVPVSEKEAMASRLSYPALLGQVKVVQDAFVWTIIEDIYGRCNVRMMRLVADVNPHIKNLDKIVAGDIVNVPTIPAQPSIKATGERYHVEIARFTDLEKALRAYRRYKAGVFPVTMLPHWSERGLQFSLLLKNDFNDEAEAKRALEAVPSEIAAEGKIIAEWTPGTVFFTKR